MQKECQSATVADSLRAIVQIVSDVERSILQESSKTMKLKGFWYIAGYCLSSKACTRLGKKEENFFSFGGQRVGLEGNVEKHSSLRGDRALEKAPVPGW